MVQISKRSSQSYTGLTAILHTTLDHLYSTDHFALRTPGITPIQKCIICGDRILWFIGNVQELIHSLHITDSQLYTLVQMKLLSLANKPFTDCVIQSKAVWTGSSYHQRT